MNILTLAAACFAGGYGLFTVFRSRTPLFYKIVVYGFGSYFLGVLYSSLYSELMPDATGFHAGYLGYGGTFFFLFSSYFGALDRLADGGEPQYRKYRLLSLFPSAFILAAGIWNYIAGKELLPQLLLIPVAGTAYFACKHLCMPDVENGIIRVMRSYNIIILILCLIQPYAMAAMVSIQPHPAVVIIQAVLVILALPLARKGVQRWYI